MVALEERHFLIISHFQFKPPPFSVIPLSLSLLTILSVTNLMIYILMTFVDLKSMLSLGLCTIASSNYDLMAAVHGKKMMRILCIGHGGGSLPLFLASTIQGRISLFIYIYIPVS